MGYAHAWSSALRLVLAYLLLSPVGRAADAGLRGEPELLMLVANGHRANVERLSTWRGIAAVETVTYADGARQVLRKTRCALEFLVDTKAKAYRMRCTVKMDPSADTPRPDLASPQEPLDGYDRLLVLKDGTAYEKDVPILADGHRAAGQQVVQICDLATFQKGGRIVEFDPRDYLTADGEEVWAKMIFYHEHAASPMLDGAIRREGRAVVLESRLRESETRSRFDLSQGCNLTELFQKCPTYESLWTYEYEQIGGVFVPRRVTWRRTDYGRERVERTIAFAQNVVNEDVDESEFSLAAMGLNPGDLIVDERIGTRYVYEPAVPFPAAGGAPTEAEVPATAPDEQ